MRRIPFIVLLCLPAVLFSQGAEDRAERAIRETIKAQQLLVDAQKLLKTLSDTAQRLNAENSKLKEQVRASEATVSQYKNKCEVMEGKVIELQGSLNQTLALLTEMQKGQLTQDKPQDVDQLRAQLAATQQQLQDAIQAKPAPEPPKPVIATPVQPQEEVQGALGALDKQIQALTAAIAEKEQIIKQAPGSKPTAPLPSPSNLPITPNTRATNTAVSIVDELIIQHKK